MEFDELKIGMRVQIMDETRRAGALYLCPATVLSTHSGLTGEPHIRLLLEDGSGEIVPGLKAHELDYE